MINIMMMMMMIVKLMMIKMVMMITQTTRSTWREQTSLAEADHYSHISQCNIKWSLGGERLTPEVLDHYLHHDLGMLPLLWCIFLLIYSS